MSGMEGNCECQWCGNPKRDQPVQRRIREVFDEQPIFVREKRKPLLSYESDVSSRSDQAAGRVGNSGTSSRPQRQLRAAGVPYAQDAEGTENVYKLQLKTLEAHRESSKGIEDDILEPNSIDWRAEHAWKPPNPHDWGGTDLVQQTLTSIEHQHSFVPRVGELVLFCPTFPDQHYLMLDESVQEYKFYSFEQKCFHGFPAWRGGVIAAIPSETATDGPVDFPDIQELPTKHYSLNTSGFRVETCPDPNNEEDKTASKQYRYLPLRNIRPLTHWQMLLRGISRSKWHTSIENALTCMTSISLLEKYYFKGDWEKERTGVKKAHASIRCKGVYMGAELITIGDSVRIMPEPGKTCTDVLVVESIRLHLRDIQAEHFSPDTPLLATQSFITLVGKAYTTDKERISQISSHPISHRSSVVVKAEEAKTIFRPVGSALYGPWYAMHAPTHRYEISHDQILGRLYEAAAVQLWAGLLQSQPVNGGKSTKPSLDYDLNGVRHGRIYATQADGRLEEPVNQSLSWFWADTRTEALDVQSFNGIEVGKFDTIRDEFTLELWKNHMRILNGMSVDTISQKFTSFAGLDLQPDGKRTGGSGTGTRGRPVGSKLINGKLYRAGEIPPGYNAPLSDQGAPLHLTPRKQKGSQLAGAALVSTDEEDMEGEDFEDANEEWGPTLEEPLEVVLSHRTSPTPKQPKKPKTKAEIMESAADEDSFSEDEEDYLAPRLARGGTEETEGGDYDPRAEV